MAGDLWLLRCNGVYSLFGVCGVVGDTQCVQQGCDVTIGLKGVQGVYEALVGDAEPSLCLDPFHGMHRDASMLPVFRLCPCIQPSPGVLPPPCLFPSLSLSPMSLACRLLWR